MRLWTADMIDDMQPQLCFGEGLWVPGRDWLVNWQTSLANWMLDQYCVTLRPSRAKEKRGKR